MARIERKRIINGDALKTIEELETESFDALVMDPPYCSGGITPAMTAGGGLRKYVETVRNGSFADSMSQYALYTFRKYIIDEARRVLKSPGYIFVFTDWRSLPVMSSAMQAGGAIWRGLVTWNKGTCRPNPGHISQTSEFLLWGTKDDAKTAKFVTNSVWSYPAPPCSKRIHPTQKPVEIYEEIVKILPDNPRVLDLFCGSAPAGVATVSAGGFYVGVDNSAAYCEKSAERIDAEARFLFLDDELDDAPGDAANE